MIVLKGKLGAIINMAMFADTDEAFDFKETAESFLSSIFDHFSRSVNYQQSGINLNAT